MDLVVLLPPVFFPPSLPHPRAFVPIRVRPLQTRALSHPGPHLSLHYQLVLFCPAHYVTAFCHVINLLDTKNSRQPVFSEEEEEEEKEQGKHSDTSSRWSAHSVQPENTSVLITPNRSCETKKKKHADKYTDSNSLWLKLWVYSHEYIFFLLGFVSELFKQAVL